MADTNFDVLVIGAGPGGYVAAIKAAQLGLKTACVDKRSTLGGTCLNVGCIPSKALLTSTHHYEMLKNHGLEHGILAQEIRHDLGAMMARKDRVVEELTKGIDFLFKKNGVTRLTGEASITAPGQVKVKDQNYSAKHIIIATGSESAALPGVAVDEKLVVSSTGALALSKVPKHMVVIGGGYIGLEMACVWRRLGSQITVVEFLDRITPSMDQEVGKALHKSLLKMGMDFKLETKVVSAKKEKSGVTLTLEPAKGGAREEITADVVLVSIGRKANTEGLGLDKVGVAMDERGRVKVDDHFQTNIPGIYAIGDVIAGPMLAHKAEEEGVALAEMLAGKAGHVNYNVIPAVVYTWPEAASVGKTEEELKAAGTEYKVGKFPFAANSRAKTNGDTVGFVKILVDPKTDLVLGCHIIGPDAGTLIAELALAMEFGASSEDIARTCHA
ncbi:MAG: dihydrolipoyl dehydrogenase, partial [Dongiaceae bacterium]